jgi:ABC-2 type transport system permease protein
MKNILHLMKKEFIQTLRDKKMIPIIFVLPVLQLILLGYAANIDIKDVSMVVCDMDKSQTSFNFISQFTNSGYFTLVKSIDSPKEIDYYIDDGYASVALMIPTDFSKNLLAKKGTSIQFICDGSDANSANIALGYAKQITALYSQNVFLENMEKSGRKMSTPRIIPEPRVWFNPELKSKNYMIPGVLSLILMIITMAMTSLGIVKEKEIGTLEQLIVTPIKRYQLIIGKVFPFAVFGLIDITLVISVAVFVFAIPIRGSVLLLFFLTLLYILITLGLGLFISTISKTQQQAMMTAMFFVMMPFMFLSGFAFPIENMPIIIQYITHIIPLKYYLIIVRGIFLKGIGIAELWKEALILLIWGISIIAISVVRFNKKLS